MPCGVDGCDVARALRASPSSMSWLLPVEFNMVGVWCDRLSRRRVGLCLRVGLCIVGTGLAPPSLADEGTDRSWSLDELLQFAEEHAPATAIARARVGVAEADVIGARPWLPSDPSIDLGAGGRVGGGQDGFDGAVGVSQTFEIFGEPALRQAAARRAVAAVGLDVDRVRFEVHQRVHQAFHEALVADAEVAAAEAAVDNARRLVEVAEARTRTGDASSLTVRLAQTAMARAREQALTARETQTGSRLALGRCAGFDDASAVIPRGTLSPPRALPTFVDVIALAEAHQPNLVYLQAQVDVASAHSALAERESLPKPTVGLGYSVEGASASSVGPTSQTQHIAQATIALPLPFFRGNDAERARAAALKTVAEAELAGERRLLAGHVKEAWTHADAARARVALFTTELLPGIDDTLQQLETAFRLGELDLTEVTVGRDQVLAARREALLAWRRWFEALSALEAEVGAEISSPSLDVDATTTTTTNPVRGAP